jgi:hypothetical protein
MRGENRKHYCENEMKKMKEESAKTQKRKYRKENMAK